MKKFLLILTVFIGSLATGMAQTEPDDANPQESKIRERMQEYIQNRLNLSRNEAEKFTPIFVRYFREFAQTHRSYKGDRLVLQQKIIDLRIRYRTEFRQIMDEQRANRVFKHEDEFRQEVVRMIRENKRERLESRPLRRNRSIVE
ncbi:MAG: hypothetical protein KAX45_01105 [Chitinophagaceae bacterium]|nr:hypothetical protein [Chitinophagaceae bacterium]MBP6588510.1 hypothetical protein [Chitinophagaceae bacterium]MBP8243108.1 hypothetical protein [Chitinophagaceae bacterium]